MNRKAYYFTLDAMIALIILSIGYLVIIGNYTFAPEQIPSQYLANDILNLLQSAKVSDFCKETCAGTIPYKNSDNTLLELVGELKYTDNPNIDNLLESAIKLPPNYKFAFWLRDGENELFSYLNGYDTEASKTKLISSSKKIIYGYYTDETGQKFWGPYEAEVRTWLD